MLQQVTFSYNEVLDWLVMVEEVHEFKRVPLDQSVTVITMWFWMHVPAACCALIYVDRLLL